MRNTLTKCLALINKPSSLGWFMLVIVAGALLRLAVAQRGFNFDIASYRIVADIMANGGNVYEETQRYNYGPIWFHILAFLDTLPFPISDPLLSLRWKVTSFLSITDIAIAVCLYRWYGFKIATLFFLNPISIIITGYHSQFDNLAILMALISIKTLDNSSNKLSYKTLLGLFLLGVCLSIKHLLFLFPFWLAFKNTRWRDKLITLSIPYTVFLASFLPYLSKGADGILNHVFLYRGFANAPFWNGVAPEVIIDKIPIFVLFIGTLLFLGLFLRTKKPLESLYLYTIALVIFSSAVANQYLAICLVAISVHSNYIYTLYSVAGTIYLLASSDGLHFSLLQHYLGKSGNSSVIGYQELVFLLFLGLLLQLMSAETRTKTLHLVKKYILCLKQEIIMQIKSPW
ncbi:conserved hypothetical protein [Bathymodiolus platifrons methanotrophic gill symbiont]|uniref:hypothetical protein n=2 Tax=Bathymodiolus platifrons methanotrophic gill symbiont TaxID=113268 RepID=UPI000B715BB2|nr:hypothetical protein [Bathymodiolus platifrons methanotrophic gill symbiont]TXL12369.1 hypothetical protein BMR05_15590 [Methylococcaceae bacterium HT4]TXL21272.1 hypothetical protein BMR06_01510 [Methylococcaceae bacterium HT5]GAW86992.1 conserved hypothetical protein [Bathymodiolus platifrons methanotrophic gill symbiont]GFO75464.1 hypothetical protein BPLS_P2705 [Bathymodiolus platifrons methanotrophic gill symbiont]